MNTSPYPSAPKNRRRRWVFAPILVASAALVLGACGAPQTGDVENSRASLNAHQQPQQGGIIEYGHLQEPNCIFGGWVQENFTARQVLDNLVSQTDEGEIVPWIAIDWNVSNDGLIWTLTLRDDVHFTDGTPLDAEAVAYNFDYWMAGGNGTAAVHLDGFYEQAVAVDDYVVEVHFSAPLATFMSSIAQSYFGLQSPTALENRTAEQNCTEPIGSGPFTVEEWRRGEYIQFTRNDDYNWAPDNARHQGPAYIAGLKWNIIPDNTSRYGSLLSGESHAIGEIPAVNVDEAEQEFDYTQYITPGRPVVINLNTNQGVFTDQQVRQALSFATDREANIESAFLGTVPFEPSGYLSQSTPDYDAGAAYEYPYDLDRANELLEEAGWTERDAEGIRYKDGQPLRALLTYGINSTITPDGATAIQNFQEQARNAGFDIVLRPLTPSENFSGAFSTPDSYDAQVGYWTSPHAGILNINFRPSTEEHPNGANTTFMDDPEVFETIQQALQSPTEAEVSERFSEAQYQLSESAAAIGLYTQTNSLAATDDVADIWLEAAQGGPVFHDAYFTVPVTDEEKD